MPILLWPVLQVSTQEFTRDRKMMSVLCHGPNGQDVIFVKGAPEAVLAKCSYVGPFLDCSCIWTSMPADVL